MRDVYALLVGIDNYDERLQAPKLKGCVNDIQQMHAFLEGRTANAVNVQVQALKNEQATRQNIVSGIRQHLAQAKRGDTALFYFAGYGSLEVVSSTEGAAPSATQTPATQTMETLVCFDSHTATHTATAHEGVSWDLADREWNQLLTEVGRQGAHVVAIIDARKMDADKTALKSRPEKDFIASSASKTDERHHVVIKSSAAFEAAYELPSDRASNTGSSSGANGSASGAFSRCLQTVLASTNGSLTYRSLLSQTNALLRARLPLQSPQIEVGHDADLELPFLGEGVIAPLQPHFMVSHDAIQGWILNGGSIHGLRSPIGHETTTLALFPQQATAEQLRQPENAIAIARITRVQFQYSTVDSPSLKNTDITAQFKAVVIDLPLPQLSVYIAGDRGETDALRRALATASHNRQPSLYVKPADTSDSCDLRVVAKDGAYQIMSAAGDRPLLEPIEGYDIESAVRAIAALEHIARWQTITALKSPANSLIQGSVDLKIYTGDEANKAQSTEITDAQVRLLYKTGSQDSLRAQTPPRFRLKLHNTSNQTLYCALFYLTERFKAAAVKPDKVNSIVQLAPNEEVWFADGLPLYGTVPDDLWQQGITECQDAMKLVACLHPFDPTLMNLGPFGTPIGELVAGDSSSLNQIMQRITHREMNREALGSTTDYDSWITNQIAFTFVRPQLPVALSAGKPEPTVLSSTLSSAVPLSVQPHAQFSAKAQLSTISHAAGRFGQSAVTLPLPSNPLRLTSGRNSASGLSVLQLTDIENAASITPEQPLRLDIGRSLAEGESILPVAYDGDAYLPLGYSVSESGSHGRFNNGSSPAQTMTQVVIERMPASSAACIVLQIIKTTAVDSIRSMQTHQNSRPQLVAAQVNPAGTVTYMRGANAIALKVKQSRAIALYLPSPFSHAEADLPPFDQILTAAGRPYSLLLTLEGSVEDKGSIEQSAQFLKDTLAEIGLTAGHEKKLHIIAHSTSGLTARWLIEQLGGDRVVDHLFLLGTPNAGISKARLRSGLTDMTALTLNGLATTPMLEALVSRLSQLAMSDQVTAPLEASRAFEQYQPESDEVQTLSQSADPGIPYTLICGDVLQSSTQRQQSVLRKLNAATLDTFSERPNDLMVSVSNMSALPQHWSTPAQKIEAGCHHMEYLTHTGHRVLLSRAIAGAATQPKIVRPAEMAKPATAVSSEAPPYTMQPSVVQPLRTQPPAAQPAQPQPSQAPTIPKVATVTAATSAGIAAASAAVAAPTLPFSRTPITQDVSAMQEPPQPPEPQQPQSPPPAAPPPPPIPAAPPPVTQATPPVPTAPPPATQATPPAPAAMPPAPVTPMPPDGSLPERSVPERSTPESSVPDLTVPDLTVPDSEAVPDVYAPEYPPSPESKGSPLMWIWVIGTAVLAGIVALLWVDYFNSPIEPSGPETIQPTPGSSESDLPAIPSDAPVAPGSDET